MLRNKQIPKVKRAKRKNAKIHFDNLDRFTYFQHVTLMQPRWANFFTSEKPIWGLTEVRRGPGRPKYLIDIFVWGLVKKHGVVISFFFSLNIMMRVSFSPGRDRACRRCWISSFWIPRENGYSSFRKDPLDIKQYLKKGLFLTFLIKIMGNHQKCVFF